MLLRESAGEEQGADMVSCRGCATEEAAEGGEEEELLTEEPGCAEAARQEARTAAGLSNAIRAWHASHKGQSEAPTPLQCTRHHLTPCMLDSSENRAEQRPGFWRCGDGVAPGAPSVMNCMSLCPCTSSDAQPIL